MSWHEQAGKGEVGERDHLRRVNLRKPDDLNV